MREGPLDHFVPLNRLPEKFRVPGELTERIVFDEGRHRLVFHGFMSKSDFDRLCRLSEDWGYRRALEDLFRLCTPEEERPSGVFRRVLTALGGRA